MVLILQFRSEDVVICCAFITHSQLLSRISATDKAISLMATKTFFSKVGSWASWVGALECTWCFAPQMLFLGCTFSVDTCLSFVLFKTRHIVMLKSAT
jgi:hypothetical protein